tara:strand:+ start:6067 stop:6669 length:603 start_codon:yes stop_codon:yes gene_type:complete
MKKVLLMMCLAFGLSQTANAQLQFGVKAGINYNNNGNLTLSGVVNNAVEGAGAKSGFHVGMWFRGKLPIVGIYIRPEVIFTQVKSEYLYKASNTSYDFKKIDVPVLVGTKLFGVANVFIGPSFQYVLNSDFGLSTVSEVSLDKFSVGMQTGFGIEFGKLGVDVRWERGLSSTEAVFVDNTTSINIDNRTNQIILGLSYRL